MPEARAVVDECMKRASEKRNQMAEILKRAFCLLMAPQRHQKKANACEIVQCKYKLKYHKKTKKWADIFKLNFEKAIIEFKSKKRMAFEEKAAKAMTDVLKKHVFRNKLIKAIKAR